jgi:hypothetical protein
MKTNNIYRPERALYVVARIVRKDPSNSTGFDGR